MTETPAQKILLSDLMPVMGDTGHGTVVWITTDTQINTYLADKRPMPADEALAAFGSRVVSRCRPYLHQDGEYAGNVYWLPDERSWKEDAHAIS